MERDAKPLPIRSWQIWNEPNLPKYFAPHPSPREYARLLQISHDAIKSRDPWARIVLAGMPGHGDMEAWDFLDRLYSVAGIKSTSTPPPCTRTPAASTANASTSSDSAR